MSLGLRNATPTKIITVFDFLTYAHLHERQRLLDLTKQMTSMTLLQSANVFMFQAPAGIAQVYIFDTENIN